MPAKTAALIQIKVWIRRNFSSCNSTTTSANRPWTVASKLSPSARQEPRNPAEAGVTGSISGYLLWRPTSTPTPAVMATA